MLLISIKLNCNWAYSWHTFTSPQMCDKKHNNKSFLINSISILYHYKTNNWKAVLSTSVPNVYNLPKLLLYYEMHQYSRTLMFVLNYQKLFYPVEFDAHNNSAPLVLLTTALSRAIRVVNFQIKQTIVVYSDKEFPKKKRKKERV